VFVYNIYLIEKKHIEAQTGAIVLHIKPCICDICWCVKCSHLPNRKIAQMQRVFFEELTGARDVFIYHYICFQYQQS